MIAEMGEKITLVKVASCPVDFGSFYRIGYKILVSRKYRKTSMLIRVECETELTNRKLRVSDLYLAPYCTQKPHHKAILTNGPVPHVSS